MPSVRRFGICVAKPKSDRPSDGVWWMKIGAASENEKGQVSLFIDALPVGTWDGRAVCFEARAKDQSTSQRTRTNDDEDVQL